VTGGLASAKAFSILNGTRVDEPKRRTVTELVWNHCKRLAEAEAVDVQLRRRGDIKAREKLDVIKMQAVSMETMSKIGAILGNGPQDEVEHLGNYGRYLYTILELRKDFEVSINLTLELAEKVRKGSMPYALLWAKNRSKKIDEYLALLTDTAEPADIKRTVGAVLETGARENTLELLKTLTQKAEAELSRLNTNNATQLLKLFLVAQSNIFMENLSVLES